MKPQQQLHLSKVASFLQTTDAALKQRDPTRFFNFVKKETEQRPVLPKEKNTGLPFWFIYLKILTIFFFSCPNKILLPAPALFLEFLDVCKEQKWKEKALITVFHDCPYKSDRHDFQWSR